MVEYKKEITETYDILCKHCGHNDTHKIGKKHNIQYFRCNACNRKFADNGAYLGMQYPKDYNLKALTYYYNGMSYKNINHTFHDLFNESIAKSTFYRWVIKFSKLVNQYVLSLHPNLSQVWIADETVIDIWGKKYWFWDIIDEGTRFLIASHLSRTRTKKDATKLFYMAKLRSKMTPTAILTDKLQAYHGAFNKVFYKSRRTTSHLTSEGFGSPTNINLIERFHGTVKQRTKVMRDLKKLTSARIVLDGFVTHYNFFLEHEYLKGITPATKGGIGDGIMNWDDLIELSHNAPKYNPSNNINWEKEFGIK